MSKTMSGKQLNARLKEAEEYKPGRQEAWVLMLTFFCVAFFPATVQTSIPPFKRSKASRTVMHHKNEDFV